jgi:hypothetical protein
MASILPARRVESTRIQFLEAPVTAISLVVWLLSSPALFEVTVSTVPCKTAADCWLDAEGRPIARPERVKGKKIPRGDCGRQILWLRHRLTCEKSVCTSQYVGDKC